MSRKNRRLKNPRDDSVLPFYVPDSPNRYETLSTWNSDRLFRVLRLLFDRQPDQSDSPGGHASD